MTADPTPPDRLAPESPSPRPESGSHRVDPSGRHWWFWALAVAAIGFVTYLPALNGDFALDDVSAVEQDVRLRAPGAVLGAFTRPYLWDYPAARSPYRPITSVTYAVNWRMGGGDPFPFHVLNVVAHVAASLLLLSVLTALGAPVTAAGPAALLFAVHPVHVEAVANIVGRGDVLVALFCLLGVRIHLSRRLSFPWRVAGVSLAYLLAVGSKENGYIFPVLLLLVQLAFPAQERAGGPMPFARRVAAAARSWPMYAALTVALGAYLVVRTSVLGGVAHLDVAAYIAVLPDSLRFTTAVANLSEVVRLLLVPADLTAHYAPAVLNPAGPGDPRFWAGIATVLATIGLVGLAFRSGATGRWVLLGLGWIVASFLLVSNLIVPLPMWLAERTLYLPSAGIGCLVVAGLVALERRGLPLRNRTVLASLILVTLAGSVHSWRYSRVWETTGRLYADLVERHPESFYAPWWTGRLLVDAGNLERGVPLLEAAVALNPNGAMVTLELSEALILAGRGEEAEARLRPIPLGLHPHVPVYLVQSLLLQGRHEDAREVVHAGLRLFPGAPRLEAQLATIDAVADSASTR